MKLKIEITMDNAAFETPGIETARILNGLAEKCEWTLQEIGDHETIMDANGNRVGTARITR